MLTVPSQTELFQHRLQKLKYFKLALKKYVNIAFKNRNRSIMPSQTETCQRGLKI